MSEDIVGSVILMKLTSREEIIGKVVKIDNGVIILEKPYVLALAKGSIQLIPFMFGDPDGTAVIYSQAWMTMPLPAPARCEDAYNEATSEIIRPDAAKKQIIMG